MLKGKVALVTGAGRGIGRTIALSLAQSGAIIILSSRTTQEILAVKDDIENMGGLAEAITCDVSDSLQVNEMVENIIKNFGKIDILINNAGQYLKKTVVPLPGREYKPPIVPKLIDSMMSDEEWQNIFSVNLNSAFYCCRAVAPYMINRKSGKIINISSNSAIQAHPLFAAYNSSKAALNMLTRVLALEWAEYNLCINAIAPGEFHTSMTDFSWSDSVEKQKRLDNIPAHKEGRQIDIGQLAVYLAGDLSNYITGQIIYIDGGLSAR